jgi:glycerol-3-phosphate acyltransferase PlsY
MAARPNRRASSSVDEHAVVKTLVMQDESARPLIVLMHGDQKVSTKNLARAIGVKSVEPCDPEVAERHSGYQVGGTSPFGTRKPMPVYVEQTVLGLDRIYINGGRRGYLVGIAPDGADQVDRRAAGALRQPPARIDAHRTVPLLPMKFAFPLLAWLAGYLIGSLSFAVIVSRTMGLADPRSYGSGNPGATNVLRSGSKKAAIATLLLDALKGVVPVLAARWGAQRLGLGGDAVEWSAALAGLGAFLGHLWPLYFHFKGGKGVATAVGVLLAINPWLGLATLATWVIIAFFFRYSSLAALVSAAFAPFYQL